MRVPRYLICIALSACETAEKVTELTPTQDTGQGAGDGGAPADPDGDGDGFLPPEDCDDGDPTVHPEADELCHDDVDNDCDDRIDEADAVDAQPWFPDADGDGYGWYRGSVTACDPPEGHVDEGSDCDDEDARVYPEADEICNDGVDNNCDGSINDCVYDGWLDASYAAATVAGTAPAGQLGAAVAGVGDINADGVDDLVIGSDPSASRSVAVVMAGPLSGALTTDDAATTITGVDLEDELGAAVGPAGDTNGDGVHDLVLGAPGGGPALGGRAYLFLGPLGSGALEPAVADGVLDAPEPDARFGAALASGDLNGDDLADVIIGAPGAGAGAAWVFLGPATGAMEAGAAQATLHGLLEGDGAGTSVATGLDFDGDGFDDLAVGAPSHSHTASLDGAAYVVQGPVTGTVTLEEDAWLRLRGATAEAQAGWGLDAVGDVNGDGYDDLLLCSPWSGEGGEGWVVLGPTTGGDRGLDAADATLAGRLEDDAGWSCSGAGDMNQDGSADLIIGAPGGAVSWFVYGPVSGHLNLIDDGDLRVVGDEDSALGASVHGIGDVTGNGLADFAVGAPGDAVGASMGGAAYVVQGLDL